MRLWHKDLIPFLPDKHLLAQWRELCAIASNIANKGTPNHLLVNKVLDYPILHYVFYTNTVLDEMHKRGFRVHENAYTNMVNNINKGANKFDPNTHYSPLTYNDIYYNWHNDRYLQQCLHNLEEKYDCGGISKEEWDIIVDHFR